MEKSEHQGAINLSAIRESTESLQNGDVLKNGENTEESQVFRNSIKCENSLLLWNNRHDNSCLAIVNFFYPNFT